MTETTAATNTKPPSAKLYMMLVEKIGDLYTSPQGKLNVRQMAKDMGVSYQAAYKWFESNRIHPEKADRLINLSKGRLSKTDFLPFFF